MEEKLEEPRHVTTRDSMLQQKAQPTIRSKEDYVATWKEYVMTQSLVLVTLSRQKDNSIMT